MKYRENLGKMSAKGFECVAVFRLNEYPELYSFCVFVWEGGGDIDNIKWKFRTGSIPIRFVASRAQVLRKSGPFGFSVPFRGPSAGRWYFIFRTRRQDRGDTALIHTLKYLPAV